MRHEPIFQKRRRRLAGFLVGMLAISMSMPTEASPPAMTYRVVEATDADLVTWNALVAQVAADQGVSLQIASDRLAAFFAASSKATSKPVVSSSDPCAEMEQYRIAVGLPARFGASGRHQKWTRSDGLGWRESKCRNDVVSSTGCCGGWWQEYISLFMKDTRMKPKLKACGVDSLGDVVGNTVAEKTAQACVAKALYDTVGFSPWRPL